MLQIRIKQLALVEVGEEAIRESHAGIIHFERFQRDRSAIPASWAVPGRVILFFGDRIEMKAGIYVPALAFIHGLIYASHGHPSGWETRMVPIKKDGLPDTEFGKEKLNMFFRYAVLGKEA
jgi:hypothetical protein